MPQYKSLSFLAVTAVVCAATGALAQNYATKPVRIITTEAGAATDIVARVISQGLTASLGQGFVVDNRGGSAVIPGGMAAHAPADGYTLLVYINALWTIQLLQDNVPYDVLRDFAPITLAAGTPNVVVVHPSLPVHTVKELIALAKSKPGQLNYSSGISGAVNHLAGELFNSMAGVNIVRVPFRGASLAVNALIGGQTQLMFATAASSMSQVKAGRLRAIAVTSAQPSPLLPGLPTVAASGVPGYEASTVVAMFAPAGTPQAILDRLHTETVHVLTRPETRERLTAASLDVIASTPQQEVAAIKAEMERMGKVIKERGIKVE